MSAALPVFLTAYDPAELPGGSLDPLGFTSGYLALADALLPGMTAAAAQATYLPMLCAGISLADGDGSGSLSATAARKHRIAVGLRFERLWCLACVLHARGSVALEDDDGAPADARVPGLRGIRYVKREVARLEHSGATVAKSGGDLYGTRADARAATGENGTPSNEDEPDDEGTCAAHGLVPLPDTMAESLRVDLALWPASSTRSSNSASTA